MTSQEAEEVVLQTKAFCDEITRLRTRVAELEANLRESQTVMERALNLAVEYPRKFDLAGMDPFRKAIERNRVVLENRCKLSYSERSIRELEAAVVLRNKGE